MVHEHGSTLSEYLFLVSSSTGDLIGIVEDPSVLPVKPSLVAYERCDLEPLASSQLSSQAQMMARGLDAGLFVLLAYPHAVSEKGTRVKGRRPWPAASCTVPTLLGALLSCSSDDDDVSPLALLVIGPQG